MRCPFWHCTARHQDDCGRDVHWAVYNIHSMNSTTTREGESSWRQMLYGYDNEEASSSASNDHRGRGPMFRSKESMAANSSPSTYLFPWPLFRAKRDKSRSPSSSSYRLSAAFLSVRTLWPPSSHVLTSHPPSSHTSSKFLLAFSPPFPRRRRPSSDTPDKKVRFICGSPSFPLPSLHPFSHCHSLSFCACV